jgi:hypothetical protein
LENALNKFLFVWIQGIPQIRLSAYRSVKRRGNYTKETRIRGLERWEKSCPV